MSEQRNIPINDLDATFMTIDPAWGKEVTEELNNKLCEAHGEDVIITNEDGSKSVQSKHLWGLLSYYTRDMRLGNLNFDLFFYCEKYLNFAGDCLREGYLQAFMASLSRVITVLELSQSRNGFLRRRSNTITQEKFESPLEPEKKSLFGGTKKTPTR